MTWNLDPRNYEDREQVRRILDTKIPRKNSMIYTLSEWYLSRWWPAVILCAFTLIFLAATVAAWIVS